MNGWYVRIFRRSHLLYIKYYILYILAIGANVTWPNHFPRICPCDRVSNSSARIDHRADILPIIHQYFLRPTRVPPGPSRRGARPGRGTLLSGRRAASRPRRDDGVCACAGGGEWPGIPSRAEPRPSSRVLSLTPFSPDRATMGRVLATMEERRSRTRGYAGVAGIGDRDDRGVRTVARRGAGCERGLGARVCGGGNGKRGTGEPAEARVRAHACVCRGQRRTGERTCDLFNGFY